MGSSAGEGMGKREEGGGGKVLELKNVQPNIVLLTAEPHMRGPKVRRERQEVFQYT